MTERTALEEASDPDTPFSRLYELVLENDMSCLLALIDNPSIVIGPDGDVTDEIMFELAKIFPDSVFKSSTYCLFGLELKDRIMSGVTNLIARKAMDPGVLSVIFSEFGADPLVRVRVASNPYMDINLLRRLGDPDIEKDESIRACVANNTSTPDDFLKRMSMEEFEPSNRVRNMALIRMRSRGIW